MISARLAIRPCGGHLVAALCGELDAVDAAAVGAALTLAVDDSPRVAVDLANLDFIDCCALGVLATVREQARRAGGDLLLAAPGPRVGRILTLAEMSPGFTVAATTTEAVVAAGWARAAAPQPCAAP